MKTGQCECVDVVRAVYNRQLQNIRRRIMRVNDQITLEMDKPDFLCTTTDVLHHLYAARECLEEQHKEIVDKKLNACFEIEDFNNMVKTELEKKLMCVTATEAGAKLMLRYEIARERLILLEE
jgi:hypothetical protein